MNIELNKHLITLPRITWTKLSTSSLDDRQLLAHEFRVKPTIELQTSGYSTLTTQAPNYTTYKLVRERALLKRKLLLPPGRQFANLDLSLPGFGQGCRDHFQGMLDMIGG